MKHHRLLVLGIDGGDLDLFRQLGMRVVDVLESRGRLGSLQRVWREDRGWAMILCGQDASFTGGYYWAHVPGTYLFRPSFGAEDYRTEPLWKRLDAEGARSAFVAVPTTFPPQVLQHGLFIAGGGGGKYPNLRECVYPNSLLQQHPQVFGKLLLDVRNQVGADLTPQRFVQLLQEETRSKERLLTELWEQHDLDFAMLAFVGADRIQHLLWPHLQAAIESAANDRYGILEYYRVLDETLIRLIDKYSPGNHVIICSDHGFASRSFEVSVNQVLVDLGFQHARLGARRSVTSRLEAKLKDRVGEGARKLYRRILPWRGHSPPRLDWNRTEAFANTAAGVWINSTDRFPQGCVSPGARNQVIERLLKSLSVVRDPYKGEKLFSKLARREDVYAGPEREGAPDVLIDLDDTYEVVNDLDPSIVRPFKAAPLYTDILPRTMSGIHGSGGVFGIIGPTVRPNAVPFQVAYTEVHGVILALLGLAEPPPLLSDSGT
jgi:predicted AlkP superfamily phosphohydrolase/phosphomutase